jgi:choline kinase
MVTQLGVKVAVLLAAGTGSRLAPLTHSSPKCLTEVNGVPILEQQVTALLGSGVEELGSSPGRWCTR